MITTAALSLIRDFPGGISSKEPTYQCRRQKRHGFNPWVGKIPWRRAWQPTPVFLPGDSPWTEEPAAAKSLQSCPTLCLPIDCNHQAPLSMGFSSQEYWSGLPCPSPGDLPNPGIKPMSLMSPALASSFLTEPPGKPYICNIYVLMLRC